jgi:mannose-6-phosphate isomerase
LGRMIRFLPSYKPTVWGSHRIATELGREVPTDNIGESWELVELDGAVSRVAGGPFAGRAIGELWREGALGGTAAGRFPVLVKWIDTAQKLSVQVHPDASACARLGKGSPTSEIWYVAEAEPGAVLLLGHYPGLDAATLKQAATGGTIGKWLYELRPRVGDLLSVAAGTLHCIGAGLLILEVQEPSDTTYRVYDWGRTDDTGKARELHVEEACVSVDFGRTQVPRPDRELASGPGFLVRPLRMGSETPGPALRVFVADCGPAKLVHERGEEVLDYGDVVVAEPADGNVRLATGTALLVTESS